MDSARLERITRSLAFMLRHQPERFDLEVDAFGFADNEDVVRALNERLGEPVDVEDLADAVESGDRQRYEIQGEKIRALYGHSIAVEPGPSAKPPEMLFVGVDSRDAERALRFGLRGGRRRFLHLALNEDDAIETGRRIAEEYTVLRIHALDAWEEGINFYDRRSLWLAEEVPTRLLEAGETYTDGEPPRHAGGGFESRGERGRGRGGARGRGRDRDRDRPRRDEDREERPREDREERPRDDRPRRSRDERPARAERDERPARAEREERPARAEREERPARAEREERPARAEREERPARAEREERPARPEREERPAREAEPRRGGRGRDHEERAPRAEREARPPREERSPERVSEPAAKAAPSSTFGLGLDESPASVKPAPRAEPKPRREPKPKAEPEKREAAPRNDGPTFGAGI